MDVHIIVIVLCPSLVIIKRFFYTKEVLSVCLVFLS